MEREQLCSKIADAIFNMQFKGEVKEYRGYGNGHINDTFLVTVLLEDGSEQRYILQRMNHEIFRQPEELMENISRVTGFLREKIIRNQGDPNRETMNLIPTKDGGYFYKDEIGSYWRAFLFIERATSFDKVQSPKDFYESAVAFGHFQHMLSDYPAQTLHETIPDFHNTPVRFERFQQVVKEDICGRADGVQDEIRFFMEHGEEMGTTMRLLESDRLPLRVTHNDTKLNNIMIDNETGKGICVIDLDTVMPGLSINDFGDSIRFGANTAAEDEQDLSRVSLDLDLFDCYTDGYLEGCCGSLTKKEIEMLPMGAKLMTMECGMRFLTDYLEGDVYFKTHRPGHNLDRTRTQIALVKDMERKWDAMRSIVFKHS